MTSRMAMSSYELPFFCHPVKVCSSRNYYVYLTYISRADNANPLRSSEESDLRRHIHLLEIKVASTSKTFDGKSEPRSEHMSTTVVAK